MTRTLNVGMIGYGFMAKAHSNAWRRVADFFPALEHQPVLKAVAARTADKVSAFADVWGYESVETDWKRLIARADIDLIDVVRAQSHAPGDRARRRRSGQMDRVREAARDERSRRRGDDRRRWSARASPTWSGTTTGACRRSRSPGS